MGNGCSINSGNGTVGLNSLRPNTRFLNCSGNDYTIKWTPSTYLSSDTVASPIVSNISQNTTYTIVATSLANSNCTNTAQVTVAIDNSNSVLASPHTTVLCLPGYVPLQVKGIGLPPLASLACGTSGTITNCPFNDSVLAIAPGSTIGNTVDYYSTPFYYYSMRGQYLFHKDELLAQGMKSGTIKSLSLNILGSNSQAYTTFRISMKCTNLNDLTGLVTGLTPVYSPTGVTTITGPGYMNFVFDQPYNWDGQSNLIVEICDVPQQSFANPIGTTWTTTGFNASVRYYNFSGGNICNNSANSYLYPQNGDRPVMKFYYCDAPDAPFQYAWKPAVATDFFISDSTSGNPSVYVPYTSTYYVYTHGRNNCNVRDSVQVYIPTHNYSLTPVDTSVCFGQSFQYRGLSVGTYQWYENGFGTPTTLSCTTCNNPISKPLTDVTYT